VINKEIAVYRRYANRDSADKPNRFNSLGKVKGWSWKE